MKPHSFINYVRMVGQCLYNVVPLIMQLGRTKKLHSGVMGSKT